jgi:hypothetical protein
MPRAKPVKCEEVVTSPSACWTSTWLPSEGRACGHEALTRRSVDVRGGEASEEGRSTAGSEGGARSPVVGSRLARRGGASIVTTGVAENDPRSPLWECADHVAYWNVATGVWPPTIRDMFSAER